MRDECLQSLDDDGCLTDRRMGGVADGHHDHHALPCLFVERSEHRDGDKDANQGLAADATRSLLMRDCVSGIQVFVSGDGMKWRMDACPH